MKVTLPKTDTQIKLKKASSSPLKTTLLTLIISLAIAFGAYFYISFQDKLVVKQHLKESSNLAEQTVKTDYDSRRKADLILLQSKVESYFRKTGKYPPSLSSLNPNYLAVVPIDPETKKDYFYEPGLDLKSYRLKTTLENGEEFLLESR